MSSRCSLEIARAAARGLMPCRSACSNICSLSAPIRALILAKDSGALPSMSPNSTHSPRRPPGAGCRRRCHRTRPPGPARRRAPRATARRAARCPRRGAGCDPTRRRALGSSTSASVSASSAPAWASWPVRLAPSTRLRGTRSCRVRSLGCTARAEPRRPPSRFSPSSIWCSAWVACWSPARNTPMACSERSRGTCSSRRTASPPWLPGPMRSAPGHSG
ncbi:MAG: hypothetical protein QOG57_3710 [Pseudonocardiales bacterium]|nr:hypothetical protein [Pseudonocardiales bacterium]